METRAYIKHVRISPIKLRFLTDAVKELEPLIALDRLGLSQKRTAKILRKAIKSAMDNGVNNHGLTAEKLKFKEIRIDEGRFLKRYRAGSRGMARPYKRRSSHITVVLEQPGVVAKPKSAVEKTEKNNKETTKNTKKVEVTPSKKAKKVEISSKKPQKKTTDKSKSDSITNTKNS